MSSIFKKLINVNVMLVIILIVVTISSYRINNNLVRLIKYINENQSQKASETAIEEKYHILEKLSTQVQIDYFNRLLTQPVYINWSDDESLKEYIYVDPSYYVQAITDIHDKVLAYTVTSREIEFNLSFKPLSDKNEIILNQTNFYTIRSEFEPLLVCHYFVGNTSPTYYFEQYYFGNPGLYQTYLLGINDAGQIKLDIPLNDGGEYMIAENNTIDCNSASEDSLKNSTPNTYMVLNGIEPANIPFSFGVNRMQVRTLNE